jgi:pyridoxine/pyridoxamine 5'-phosphate oxidase
MTKTDIYQFIAKQKLGVLATLSPGGRPQSALVGIAVTPELEIIFNTVKNSRKFQNLVSNSGCSFVVGWTGEITVQYEGQAGQPKGVALAR